MIQMTEINKFYYDHGTSFQALKDINLTIPDGDFLAIQGKSGAGKSTLLHILGGVDDYDSGDYFLDTVDISTLSNKELAALRNSKMGFVFQDFSLINYKSVLFNTMIPLYFNKTPLKSMKSMALDVLRMVGIENQAYKKANQLSGGQRQRVAIARAIVNHPSIILADEPTGALDTETSKQIMSLFEDLNAQGLSVIIVTHDDTIANYCKRRIIIQDGEIIHDTLLAE